MRGDAQQAVRIRNERVKHVAGFVNALAIGIIGMAIFRPVAEGTVESWWPLAVWSMIGLATHLFSHYALSYLKPEAPDGTL